MSVKRKGFYDDGHFDSKVDGKFVDYEDYAALEAKCAALAAELSAVLTDRAVILEDFDNTCFEIGMQRGEKSAAYPTPTVANHEAFLAEMQKRSYLGTGKAIHVVGSNSEFCSKHPQTKRVVHPYIRTASMPSQPVYYCPDCEPDVAEWERKWGKK